MCINWGLIWGCQVRVGEGLGMRDKGAPWLDANFCKGIRAKVYLNFQKLPENVYRLLAKV